MKNIFEKINQLDGVSGKIAFQKGTIYADKNLLNLHFISDFTVNLHSPPYKKI